MHLKSIKASGFKSFADKTELEIQKGITAVVGPNGSGKSNIVDAIKWVLGEQSVKSLRGNNAMTDVIFSGSESRSSQTRAMVSLTFDNTDHYLNSEFNEIEIKRVVYRTGENEYYINNAKVRLKDITELFIDSGAGKESFNIISQGAVADIINSKPEERRPIFEEAAGVLKYKKRKEESIRKLDRTKENLEKVELLISELEISLTPLKEQSDKAKEYLSYKKDLENIEIALITKDIELINDDYQKTKQELEIIQEETNKLETNNSEEVSKIEKLKLTSLKIEDEINKTNEELLKITDDLAALETQKQIVLERNKFQVDKDTISQTIIELKEQSLSLENKSKLINEDLKIIKDKYKQKQDTLKNNKEEYDKLTQLTEATQQCIHNKDQDIQKINNTISILIDNIENNNRLPYSVKNVLNNPRLKGIHNTIGNLIDSQVIYTDAIDTALGMNSNVLVVNNETSAKEAINYLKDNKLGRATFFPLNIIKKREVDQETLSLIQKAKGFIDIASNLVKYDPQYDNVIKNQLGNVIVVEDIDALNAIGRQINFRYRIVSLAGDIQHTGGSITGGSIKNTNSIIKDKQALEEAKQTLSKQENELKKFHQKHQDQQATLEKLKACIESTTIEIVSITELINQKNNELEEVTRKSININNDIENTNNQLENKLDDALNNLLNDLYKKSAEKDLIQKRITNLRSEKSDLATEIAELENLNRQKNSIYNKQQQQLKEKEIKLSKMDVKLDNLLLNLNETYNMTYERAKSEYALDLDIDTARLKVSNLKSNIDKLGLVNLGAPEEFARINTRYEFLNNQKTELDSSVSELLKLISEMDEIMISRFKESFSQIEQEFSRVFKKLFKGGKGILKLTNEEDLLNTGIDIIAEPPGKKLNSIALLSGGEKTLTAIALLFSILNIKTVPFCVLDEVEAALDEANVDAFGKYLQEKKDSSQFIIITHKKKTMEYADVLYGITMQESGVSKLVSVKLEGE